MSIKNIINYGSNYGKYSLHFYFNLHMCVSHLDNYSLTPFEGKSRIVDEVTVRFLPVLFCRFVFRLISVLVGDIELVPNLLQAEVYSRYSCKCVNNNKPMPPNTMKFPPLAVMVSFDCNLSCSRTLTFLFVFSPGFVKLQVQQIDHKVPGYT